jgi:hypothetical protein
LPRQGPIPPDVRAFQPWLSSFDADTLADRRQRSKLKSVMQVNTEKDLSPFGPNKGHHRPSVRALAIYPRWFVLCKDWPPNLYFSGDG